MSKAIAPVSSYNSRLAAKALGLDLTKAAQSLSHFACGFGRMEKFEIGGADVRMILIKNPAGCNQVLSFLTQRTEPFVFAACLNDRLKLRSMVVGEKGDMVYIASEESAIRVIQPTLDKVWAPGAASRTSPPPSPSFWGWTLNAPAGASRRRFCNLA